MNHAVLTRPDPIREGILLLRPLGAFTPLPNTSTTTTTIANSPNQTDSHTHTHACAPKSRRAAMRTHTNTPISQTVARF